MAKDGGRHTDDPQIWTNLFLVLAAAVAAGRRMYLFSAALIFAAISSTLYHKSEEKRYEALDMFAVGTVIAYGVAQTIMPGTMKPLCRVACIAIGALMITFKCVDTSHPEVYEHWHPWFHTCCAIFAMLIALVGTPIAYLKE